MSGERRHDPITRASILTRLRQDPSEWRRRGLTPPDVLARIVAEHLNAPPTACPPVDAAPAASDDDAAVDDEAAVYTDFFTGSTPTA